MHHNEDSGNKRENINQNIPLMYWNNYGTKKWESGRNRTLPTNATSPHNDPWMRWEKRKTCIIIEWKEYHCYYYSEQKRKLNSHSKVLQQWYKNLHIFSSCSQRTRRSSAAWFFFYYYDYHWYYFFYCYIYNMYTLFANHYYYHFHYIISHIYLFRYMDIFLTSAAQQAKWRWRPVSGDDTGNANATTTLWQPDSQTSAIARKEWKKQIITIIFSIHS